MHASLLNDQKTAIDAEFGPGTFDAEFSTLMNARVANLRSTNPQALSDPAIMATEIQSIKGLKLNALVDRRTAFQTSGEEAKSTERQKILDEFRMSGISGSYSPPAPTADAPMSDAEKDFIAAKERAGQTVDMKANRAARARDGQQINYPTGGAA